MDLQVDDFLLLCEVLFHRSLTCIVSGRKSDVVLVTHQGDVTLGVLDFCC